ncbi:MAG: anti-sigma factor antagonist [Armatimonadota bacterium]
MTIDESIHGNTTVLKLQGRIDATSVSDTEKHLTGAYERGVRQMVLDLSGVDYISSAGLRVLLSSARRLQQGKGKLVIATPSDQARHILDMAGFSAIIPVIDSIDDAIGSYAPPREKTASEPMMLSFAEEIYLLALDDKQGDIKSLPASALDYALSGALLMELAINDRIDNDAEGLKVTSPEPTKDPLLDYALEKMKLQTHTQPTSVWLNDFANRAERLQKRVLTRLIDRSILKQEDRKVLWVFNVRRYPMQDNCEVKEVRERLRDIILSGDIPDPRDIVLISLGNACGLLDDLFSEEEIPTATARIAILEKMDLIGQETTIAIHEIQNALALMSTHMMWSM